MGKGDTGQVTRSAAEVYEEFFVPALFQEWAGRVADAAGVHSGQRVLDVACGTGVLAREAAERVKPSGTAGLQRLREARFTAEEQTLLMAYDSSGIPELALP